MNIQNNTIKRMAALLICLCLMLAMGVTAYAHEVPDLTRTGSLSVTMTYDGKAVPGGMLTLYRVGAVSEEDGNYSFVLTEDFAGSHLSLEDISSDTLAEKLSAYASNKGLTGTKVTIGTDGKASASGLTLGLYLVVQTRAADGYEAVSPFLVSVPMNEKGTYIYDVDASPKTSLTSETPTPSTPSDPNLPQTGQLNWPVPVLAVLGLCLFLFGWALRFGAKKERHEA